MASKSIKSCMRKSLKSNVCQAEEALIASGAYQ